MTATAPSLCARCAREGRTCCQGREIYITAGDRRRIRAYTGGNDFVEWSAATDPAYQDQDDDPVWRQHVLGNGRRPILKRTPDGDCFFLGAGGCRLPNDVRPLLCRLHPLTYTADRIGADAEEECPRHLLADGESVLEAVNITMDLARRWHRQLYEEIMTDDPDDRTDLRPSL